MDHTRASQPGPAKAVQRAARALSPTAGSSRPSRQADGPVEPSSVLARGAASGCDRQGTAAQSRFLSACAPSVEAAPPVAKERRDPVRAASADRAPAIAVATMQPSRNTSRNSPAHYSIASTFTSRLRAYPSTRSSRERRASHRPKFAPGLKPLVPLSGSDMPNAACRRMQAQARATSARIASLMPTVHNYYAKRRRAAGSRHAGSTASFAWRAPSQILPPPPRSRPNTSPNRLVIVRSSKRAKRREYLRSLD